MGPLQMAENPWVSLGLFHPISGVSSPYLQLMGSHRVGQATFAPITGEPRSKSC